MDSYINLYEQRKENSIYWFNKSSDLYASAAALWCSREKEHSAYIKKNCGLSSHFSLAIATPPVYKMLCGMSLELLYKAICVEKNIELPMTHQLIELAQLSGISHDEAECQLLELLTHCIIWYGRYPIPKQEKHLKTFKNSSQHLLFNKKPLGKLYIFVPNHKLDWDEFNSFRLKIEKEYWKLRSS